MIARKWLGSAVGAALCAAPAAAETLQDALVQAYGTSPVLASARAQLRGIDEGVPIAKSNARLQVSGTLGVTQSTDGLTTFQNGGRALTGGVNLSYPLFQGGRVKNAINAAEARVIAGRADLRTSEGNLFTQAVSAYMNVIRDQSVVALNASNVRVLETNLRASRDRFQVGDLTRTDVAQSEARLAIARSQLATAQGNLTSSRETYRQVVGLWPEKLEQPPELPKLPATADDAVNIALSNAPTIASATAATQAAGYDVRSAGAARLPIFSVTGGSSYSDYLNTRAQSAGQPKDQNYLYDQTVGQNRIGLQMTVPLYQGGGVSARVRQAKALESSALEQGIDVERRVIANTRAAYANFSAAGEAIRAYQQAVSANRLALEGARAENTAGTRTVIEVLNAEQEYLNSQVSLVSAQRDQYVAGFALLNAMGQAQADHLNLDGGALYDPVSNYGQVRNRYGDWSDGRKYQSTSTHTTGETPKDADVQPLAPDPLLGPDTSTATMPPAPGSMVPNPGNVTRPPQ
ncbi:TolC family outer membrane protein [Sphingomonas sp. AP4-R1]|uniref:TolC family outer membrane protein n=1 Tax=Sphingomonas sp. AP4-R1 TaxID=2735134 RepID=UPI0014935B32|nr:TolC family outer membrane protein [Sphingomonas sp. AP4-R1]QJU56367.1 TolC family outer membrane protein [Sphingomonas sp. AP4-R1]